MTKGRAKSFADSLKERLDEYEVAKAVGEYMSENKIGFSRMAKKFCCSESQLSRILLGKVSGKQGLTMATIAHLGAAMDLKPHIAFQKC